MSRVLFLLREALTSLRRNMLIVAGAILAGKGLSVLAIGVTSLLVIWAVTALALGADWGDPTGVTLLIVAIIGLIVFYWLGGSIDVDADVRSPDVNVEPGSLPDVNVERAPEAEAGDRE